MKRTQHPPRLRLRRPLALMAVIGMTAAVALVATAGTASAKDSGTGTQQNPYTKDAKIRICHRDNDSKMPYGPKASDVDFKSIIKDSKGHQGHDGPLWNSGINSRWGDIIPEFWYMDGRDAVRFAGMNWPAGQSLLGNDCQPSAKVTLTKEWVGANTGDKVNLTASTGKKNSSTVSATAPNGPKNTASITARVGDTVALLEEFTKGSSSDYTGRLSCGDVQLSNDTFEVTDSMIGTKIICKFTNTKLDDDPETPTEPETGTLTLVKKVMDGNTDVTGEADLTRWGLTATSGKDVVKFDSGQSREVTAGVPYDLSENTIPGYANGSWMCTLDQQEQPPPSFRRSAVASQSVLGDPVTVADGESVTCTITNTKDTPKDNGGGGNQGGGNSTIPNNNPTTTTTDNDPEPESSAEPVVQVEAAHQEIKPPAPAKPVVQVAGVSHTAAPSANAHTGEGQSPWVYLVFAAGLALMLAALRVRRSHGAQ